MAAKTGAEAATPASANENPRPVTTRGRHWTLNAAGLKPAIGDNSAENAARKAAQAGCDALLRAQLATGAHWIRDRETFVAACASVGLAA